MNKSLLAVAIAGALVAPAAMADVVIYGKIAVAVEAFKADQTGSLPTLKTTRVDDETSKIGFKGTEDLGNGLNAIWQVESRVRPDDGGTSADTNGFASRNSFVGLSSATVGTVKLGRHDTPYKSLTAGNLNVFADGIADQANGGQTANSPAKGNGVFGLEDTRLKNTVLYESPVFGGFQGKLAYGTGENKSNTVSNTDVWSASGLYSADLFELGAAYQEEKNGTQNYALQQSGGKIDSYKLYAGLKLSALYLGAGYEEIKVDGYNTASVKSNDGKQKNYLVSAVYTLGATKLIAEYGNADDFSAVNNSGSTQWTVGASYDLSKRTMVRAYYTDLKNESAAQRTFAVNAPSNLTSAFGTELSAFNVGVWHKF